MNRRAWLASLGGLGLAGVAAGHPARAEHGPATSAALLPLPGRTPRDTIRDVEIYAASIPLRKVTTIAIGVALEPENVLVRLRTAGGVSGWGESSPYSAVMSETQSSDLAIARPLADLVRGRDPFTLPRIAEAMDVFSPGNPGIKSAFETALWDVCGRLAGLPVYRLLGAYRESFETDLTLHLDPLDKTLSDARDAVAAGFRAIKLKLGEGPGPDVARVRAVREAVGPRVALRLDANQGWSPAGALQALRAIAPFDVEFCEQPVRASDWDGMRHVRQASPVPIMADESVHSPADAIAGIRHGAMDMINIKLMKCGGLMRGAEIARIAEAANLPCMIGCFSESRVGLTAAAHLVLSQRNIRFADLDSAVFQSADFVNGGMDLQGGTIRVSDAPGFGIEIEPGYLKTLRPLA